MFMTVTGLTVTCLILPCMMTTSSQLRPIKGLKAELNDVAGRQTTIVTKVVTVSNHILAVAKKWGDYSWV